MFRKTLHEWRGMCFKIVYCGDKMEDWAWTQISHIYSVICDKHEGPLHDAANALDAFVENNGYADMDPAEFLERMFSGR
jgi:hypothetical protein